MKHRILAVALALAVVGSLSTAAIAVADDRDKQATHHGKTAHPASADDDNEAADEDGDGAGPPPWAHGGRADKGWKTAWHRLTPAQRAAKMQALAKQHTEGMKKWSSCVRAAGTDQAARARCERPLPPGLAKKRGG